MSPNLNRATQATFPRDTPVREAPCNTNSPARALGRFQGGPREALYVHA
jgi:hypothetical protein